VSKIQQLIRIAALRNKSQEYATMRFRVLKSLIASFRRKTMEDGLSGNVVIEAFLRGYLNSHPAVMAMVDQWVNTEMGEDPPERRSPKLSKRDLEEIYAASARGMSAKEETDG